MAVYNWHSHIPIRTHLWLQILLKCIVQKPNEKSGLKPILKNRSQRVYRWAMGKRAFFLAFKCTTILFGNFENILKLLFRFLWERLVDGNEFMCIYFMRIDTAAACVRSVSHFFSPPCDGAHLSSEPCFSGGCFCFCQCTSGHSFSHSHASLWVILS